MKPPAVRYDHLRSRLGFFFSTLMQDCISSTPSPQKPRALVVKLSTRGNSSESPPTPTTVVETEAAAFEVASNGGGDAHDDGGAARSDEFITRAAVDRIVAGEAVPVTAAAAAAAEEAAAAATARRAAVAAAERDASRCAEANARIAADRARVACAAARVMLLSRAGKVPASLRAAADREEAVAKAQARARYHPDRLVRRCGSASAVSRLSLSRSEPEWCSVGVGVMELASAARRV